MKVPMVQMLVRKAISILADKAKAVAPVRIEESRDFVQAFVRGKHYYCPVCNHRIWRFDFLPMWFLKAWDEYGYIHSIFTTETLNIFSYCCPRCGASDRDRLYALYLKQEFSKIDVTKRYKFIDFGPTLALAKALRKYKFLNYRTADRFMDNVDDRVDIANMPRYKDNSIDIFLCSHVLEHVEDDKKAIDELYRILNPSGWGIVMVPISLSLSDTYEDASITTQSDRWKHFGLNDHLRIYSKQGFISRLQEAGFEVNEFGIDYFGTDVFERDGIHPRSILYVVRKPVSK